MEPGLTRSQSAAIKAYLDVQEGGNAEGDLHQHINSDQRITWRCQVHNKQYFHHKSLTFLRNFVDHQGRLNMQKATIRAVLQSSQAVDQFRTLVRGTQQIFNLSLKLNWKISRNYVKEFCHDIAKTKAVTLDIDGITTCIHPQGCMPYIHNLFVDTVSPDLGLQVITLLNYPRPQEQCIYIGKFSLQSKLSPARSAHSWVELRTDLEKFGNMVSNSEEPSECITAVKEFQLVQMKHGLTDTTTVTIHNEKWAAVFDLQEGAVIEAYSMDAACPLGLYSLYSSGSLLRLKVDANGQVFSNGFANIVQTYHYESLQELKFWYYGCQEFHSTFFHVVQTNAGLQKIRISCHGALELDRNFFQVVQTNAGLQELHILHHGDLVFNNNFFRMVQTLAGLQELHISYYRDLEFNSNFFRMVQTNAGLWELDVSHRGDPDFMYNFSRMVQTNTDLQELKIWSRGYNMVYNIEHIIKMWHVFSSTFRLTLLDHLNDTQCRVVAQLGVQGSELPENNTTSGQGLDAKTSSHQIDWTIPEGIEFLQWDCDHCFSQLSDYSASFLDMATEQHPLALTMFTLDLTQLTDIGLASVKRIFGRSNLEYLQIICTPITPNLCDSLSQVLHSIQWSALKSLVLCGDNIDEWIKLWSAPVASQLLYFTICGSGSTLQELSHPSVLFIHQLVYLSLLVDMKFENVQLQDKRDWILIAESLNSVQSKRFSLCKMSKIQFMSSTDALDLSLCKVSGATSMDTLIIKTQIAEQMVAQKPITMPQRDEGVVMEKPKTTRWKRFLQGRRKK